MKYSKLIRKRFKELYMDTQRPITLRQIGDILRREFELPNNAFAMDMIFTRWAKQMGLPSRKGRWWIERHMVYIVEKRKADRIEFLRRRIPQLQDLIKRLTVELQELESK